MDEDTVEGGTGLFGTNWGDVYGSTDYFGLSTTPNYFDPYSVGTGFDPIKAGGSLEDWMKDPSVLDYVKKAGKTVKELFDKYVNTRAGMTGLGALANYLDRVQPSGGGYAKRYTGYTPIQRTIVQGKYGPIAQYSAAPGGITNTGGSTSGGSTSGGSTSGGSGSTNTNTIPVTDPNTYNNDVIPGQTQTVTTNPNSFNNDVIETQELANGGSTDFSMTGLDLLLGEDIGDKKDAQALENQTQYTQTTQQDPLTENATLASLATIQNVAQPTIQNIAQPATQNIAQPTTQQSGIASLGQGPAPLAPGLLYQTGPSQQGSGITQQEMRDAFNYYASLPSFSGPDDVYRYMVTSLNYNPVYLNQALGKSVAAPSYSAGQIRDFIQQGERQYVSPEDVNKQLGQFGLSQEQIQRARSYDPYLISYDEGTLGKLIRQYAAQGYSENEVRQIMEDQWGVRSSEKFDKAAGYDSRIYGGVKFGKGYGTDKDLAPMAGYTPVGSVPVADPYAGMSGSQRSQAMLVERIKSGGGDPLAMAAASEFSPAKAAELLKQATGKDYSVEDIKKAKYGKAKGGLVTLEDGGFVLTKKAVDGAGGERGIKSLVPEAQMIRGPGTGTSDSIPAKIVNNQTGRTTPAAVSNGEAYVPKHGVQRRGGASQLYAMMNSLQRRG